jgi:hypothetical protein
VQGEPAGAYRETERRRREQARPVRGAVTLRAS